MTTAYEVLSDADNRARYDGALCGQGLWFDAAKLAARFPDAHDSATVHDSSASHTAEDFFPCRDTDKERDEEKHRELRGLQAKHRDCMSDWWPVAGAGAVGFPPQTFKQATATRVQGTITGDFAAPCKPRQLERKLPKLVKTDADGDEDQGGRLLGRACVVCGAEPEAGSTFRRCGGSGCRARYCTPLHQKQGWKMLGHKQSCGSPAPTLKSVAAAQPDEIVALLQEFCVSERLVGACLEWCSNASPEALARLGNVGGEKLIAHAVSAHATTFIDSGAAAAVLDLFPAPELSRVTDAILLAILARVPRLYHQNLTRVCKRWRIAVRNEPFVDARRACPLTGNSLLEPMVLCVGGHYDAEEGGAFLSRETNGLTSMLMRDGAKSRWIQVQPAPSPSMSANLVAMDEELYLFAGNHSYRGHSPMSTSPGCPCAMVWSPRSNHWRAIEAMTVPRQMAAACAHKGIVYCFGGITRLFFGDCIPSNELFSPHFQRWIQFTPMPVPCYCAQACAVGNDIYVLGGASLHCSDTHWLDFIQVYNTERRTWSVLDKLTPNRRSFPVSFGQTIVCFGGKEEEVDLSNPAARESSFDEETGETYYGTEEGALFADRSQAEAYMSRQLAKAGENKKKSKKKSKQKNKKKRQWQLHPSPLLNPPAGAAFAKTYPSDEVWSLDVSTLKWTQLPSAPKQHYPRNDAGYFYVDGTIVRDAMNPDLNFNLETQTWEDDPGRAVLRNHRLSMQPVAMMVPF